MSRTVTLPTIRTRSETRCYLCRSNGSVLFDGFADRLCSVPGSWKLRRCTDPTCGLVWLDPAPVEEDPHAAFRDAEKRPLDAKALIVPAVIWLFVCIFFGVSSVFNMRSNGQFAWYFKRHLDLIGEAKQIVYKPKEVDETGEPIVDPKKAKQQKIAGGIAGVLLLYVAANIILYFSIE